MFDAERFTNHATWMEPQRHVEGVQWRVVNGVVAVEAGKQGAAMAGRVLARSVG